MPILGGRGVSRSGRRLDRHSRDEGNTLHFRAEAPLLEHGCEGLQEREDESITEAAEQRQKEHDRLGYEHRELRACSQRGRGEE